eukprot:scaffold13633_cov64-Phaeocystis_antarctica.AAC.5
MEDRYQNPLLMYTAFVHHPSAQFAFVYRVCTSSINKGERGKGQCKDNQRGRVLVHPRGPQSIVMPGAIDDRGGSDGRRRVLCGGERSIPPHTLWAGRPLE